MHFFLSVLLGLFSLIPSTGCVKIEDASSDSERQQQNSESFLKKAEEPTLKLEVLSGEFPREYSVLLIWEKNTSFKKWIIKKSLVEEKSSGFTEALEPQALSWLDKEIKEGQKIQYELWGITFSEERLLLGSQTTRIPTDIVVEGDQHISQWEGLLQSKKPLGKLFFGSQAKLQIEDKDFKVQVQELISEDGVLLSFSSEATAPIEKKGRNGGHIQIKAQKARGFLLFQLSGETGGDGKDGDPFEHLKMLMKVKELPNYKKGERWFYREDMRGAEGEDGAPAQYGDRELSCHISHIGSEFCMQRNIHVL